MAKIGWNIITVLLLVNVCEPYKILVIFPIPGISHGILGDGVIKHLLNAGHEVTSIVAFKKNIAHSNLTQIVPEFNNKISSEDYMNLKAIMDKTVVFSGISFVLPIMTNRSISTIKDANVQKLLQDPTQKFDVIIGEWMFSDIYSTLPAIYDCPFIWFSTMEPHYFVLGIIDEYPNPAYTPDYSASYEAPYSFGRRLEQLWKQIRGYVTQRQFTEQEKQVYHTNIVPILRERGKIVPEYEDLIYNISLMLGNSHVSLGLAPRLPQNYKPIGGYHISRDVEPLPDDLKKILDNSKNGLIFFSLGSNLQSKDMPESLKQGLLKMFGNLKQTVLWKFEKALPNAPKNVLTVTWAPQQSILAHPNCILFITHGGLLSITEAIHFGKPVIGIPVFADQFSNVDRIIHKGFARKVDLSYDMDEELKVVIDEMLENPKYSQKAKEWSFIYHDRPVTPDQELVHWVEHVIKTNGANHLRSIALIVPWYQKLFLDLLALIFAVLIFIAVVIKFIVGRVLGSGKSVEKKNN